MSATDPFLYKREYNKDGTEKHVAADGARYHVVSYHGIRQGTKIVAKLVCSCKNCEINKAKP